ncbi:MAG: hypothetical protein WDZ83_04270 [Rhizobiaceae bacterium]
MRGRPASGAVPRISVPGYTVPVPLPLPPAPDDEIAATRLALRLAPLARALDDLPREAKRFARWRARNLAGTQNNELRNAGTRQGNPGRRIWPLRLGRPPGSPSNRRPAHAVHQILEDVHGLAFWVLEAPDTS